MDELDVSDSVSAYYSAPNQRHLHVFIKRPDDTVEAGKPSDMCSFPHLSFSLLSDHAPLNRSPESYPHHEAVTFKLRCRRYDSDNLTLIWDDVIDLNGYVRERQLPPFVAGVVEKPRRAADQDRVSANHVASFIKVIGLPVY